MKVKQRKAVIWLFLKIPLSREPHRARGDNFTLGLALISGMHETSNADWWDARVTVDYSLPVRLSTSIHNHN